MFNRYASGINFEINTAAEQGLPYQVARSCHQKWDILLPEPGEGAAMSTNLTSQRERRLGLRLTGAKTEFRTRRGNCESTVMPEVVGQRHEVLECKLRKLDDGDKALCQARLTRFSGPSSSWSRTMPLEPR